MANFWNRQTTVISGIVITVLCTFYIYQSPTQLNISMSQSTTSNSVPGLEFKLTQISHSPPSLIVTLKNTSPDTPYTVLKWGTPFDSSALNTGVFSITKEEGGKVEQVVLQINRKMPPSQEEFVTIAPGTEEEVEVVFDKPWMPEARPAKYKVKAAGEFKGVWGKYGDGVTEDEKSAYIESPFSGKTFTTNEVVMEVH
ncbi:hypothetical protein EJ02DRAFT_13955 [Clathrospora elynae]|uniref:Uncharacterized protein n=1 Tax=Clathrospora elynae TaxID=706981 RepID=A0A6A5T076_9PLEO|nr:hypothetical protein EJ02DRAFT_13955 [Clathrospora elynae]